MIFQAAWSNWEFAAARSRAEPEDEAAAQSLLSAEESADWIWDWASRLVPPIADPVIAWRQGDDRRPRHA